MKNPHNLLIINISTNVSSYYTLHHTVEGLRFFSQELLFLETVKGIQVFTSRMRMSHICNWTLNMRFHPTVYCNNNITCILWFVLAVWNNQRFLTLWKSCILGAKQELKKFLFFLDSIKLLILVIFFNSHELQEGYSWIYVSAQ